MATLIAEKLKSFKIEQMLGYGKKSSMNVAEDYRAYKYLLVYFRHISISLFVFFCDHQFHCNNYNPATD